MKYNVIRSHIHYEFAQVEADSYNEAIEEAKHLDEEDWEGDDNAELLEFWDYDAEEIENDE